MASYILCGEAGSGEGASRHGPSPGPSPGILSPACGNIGTLGLKCSWSSRSVGAKYLVRVFAENEHQLSSKAEAALLYQKCIGYSCGGQQLQGRVLFLLNWSKPSAMFACGRRSSGKEMGSRIMPPLSPPGHGTGDTGAEHSIRDRAGTCGVSVCRLLVHRPLSCAGQLLSLMVRQG